MKTVVSKGNSNATSGTAADVNSMPVVKTEPTLVSTDAGLAFSTPNPSTATGGNNNRPISLDLNKVNAPAKKQRLVAPSPLILDSSDLPSLKSINTPDIEILLSSSLLPTPQPGVVFPTKVGTVTSEQEAFGKGFEEALHSLHNSQNSQVQLNTSVGSNPTVATTANTTTTAGTGMSGGSFTYTNLESTFPIAIKDEPQNPPDSPPVNPIDMEAQEKIKLERKRQRNRVAASKCRKRKLERISKLEDKVKILKSENTDLGLIVKNLKDHVAQLKQQVIEHIETGCNISSLYNGSALLQAK